MAASFLKKPLQVWIRGNFIHKLTWCIQIYILMTGLYQTFFVVITTFALILIEKLFQVCLKCLIILCAFLLFGPQHTCIHNLVVNFYIFLNIHFTFVRKHSSLSLMLLYQYKVRLFGYVFHHKLYF